MVAVILQQQAGEQVISAASAQIQMHAYMGTFWWAVGFAALILPLAAFLPRKAVRHGR